MGGKKKEKWIKHYSSRHKILLVGEGDFSFAACLATAFGLAPNITATTLHSETELRSKHSTAEANLEELEGRGSTVLYNVDVWTMHKRRVLKNELFDRIVFNFPHAGFYYRENDQRQIDLHKEVVRGFLKNARKMLRTDGQVHITHKTSYPFSEWKIVQLAEESSLILIEETPFVRCQYPGYINKRGSNNRHSNRTFPVGECSTFKFVRC